MRVYVSRCIVQHTTNLVEQRAVLGLHSLRLNLTEASLDHVLDLKVLDTQEVENHVVGEAELGLEHRHGAENHLVNDARL